MGDTHTLQYLKNVFELLENQRNWKGSRMNVGWNCEGYCYERNQKRIWDTSIGDLERKRKDTL